MNRDIRLIALALLLWGIGEGLFLSMYLVFPLAPNFLSDVRGLSTAQVGALGSVYAVGTTLLSLLLGRMRGGSDPGGWS